MTTAIISQARMTSTRLPGKVLKSAGNRSLLNWHLTRLKSVSNANSLILAITKNDADDPLVKAANALNVTLFRGSETDVLSRYYHAATEAQASLIVRVTSDCPLIDPTLVQACIELQISSGADYVSNISQRSYPRGLDVEVFTYQSLKTAAENANTAHEREHVTPYIRNHQDQFKQAHLIQADLKLSLQPPINSLADMRWTVDTPEDFLFMEKLLSACQNEPLCPWQEVLNRLLEHPEWLELNAHIQQKTV